MDEHFCTECGLLSSKVKLYNWSKEGEEEIWMCEKHITKELNLHLIGGDSNG